MPREAVLIAALSGRALAQSARAAGLRPVVLDAFGDLDTAAAADASARVPVDTFWRFEPDALLEAARRLAPAPMPLIWGSGFEAAPDLLARLAEGRELLGCPPEVVRGAKDPLAFQATCRRLAIPHPEVRLDRPKNRAGWVGKRIGGAGGAHVVPARRLLPGADRYFQRRVAGRPVSALLLANGKDARVLGFSEQLFAPARSRMPRRFVGCVAPAPFAPPLAGELVRAACALARTLGLCGLASADFLVADQEWHVLEVNPRPGASLEAYELAFGMSLVGDHLRACRGELTREPRIASRAAATLIAFTLKPLRIPLGFGWPEWAGDQSPDGLAIPAGGPVCTVSATAATPADALHSCRLRLNDIARRLRPAAVAA